MNNEIELTAALLTIEKCRELSGCPAGVDLQDWVKMLAAENVALKLKGRELLNEASKVYQKYNATIDFYSGDFMDGQTLHEFQFVLDADTPATDRIAAGIKASAIPEGFKLVPEQMYLSGEDIQAICMQCGNGDKKGYGDYEDGILWVGELSNDGEVKYGLNIANANYPEEGSITVFEFDDPLREGADK
ncbi:hypothetical protein [Klebsiella aerogenes]|uniref:hypothetical protein n=1 Tax=Klebsiella aerogenes TaxID=548 RepID=UPI00149531D8|nr:hypothetical protein [Klebsiella aerogenes]NPD97853.1 hypothetical protein [Klebsiella aerogenes]